MENTILNIKVTLSICLDTRKHCQTKQGTFPIKYRISNLGVKKYFATGNFLTEIEFEKMFNSKRTSNELQTLKAILEKRKSEMIEVLNKHFVNYYSHSDFETKLKDFDTAKIQTVKIDNTVYTSIMEYIETLKSNNQFGSAEAYLNTLKSLKSFHKKSKLLFEEITVNFLNNYQNFMLKNGKSITTIGMYLRSLRCIFNMAQKRNIVPVELYPFGKNKFEIPAISKAKTALNIEEIALIMNYETENPSEHRAKDIFIFSYLCNGVNMADIARLQFKQYKNDRILFIREKTKKTTFANQKEIQIDITQEIKPIIDTIIEKWGLPNQPENYIFGILDNTMNEETKRKKVKQATKTLNKYIHRIGANLGITKELTTYTARHSNASILANSGANINFIKEKLGHKSTKTTENYIHSIGNTSEIVNNLIPKLK